MKGKKPTSPALAVLLLLAGLSALPTFAQTEAQGDDEVQKGADLRYTLEEVQIEYEDGIDPELVKRYLSFPQGESRTREAWITFIDAALVRAAEQYRFTLTIDPEFDDPSQELTLYVSIYVMRFPYLFAGGNAYGTFGFLKEGNQLFFNLGYNEQTFNYVVPSFGASPFGVGGTLGNRVLSPFDASRRTLWTGTEAELFYTPLPELRLGPTAEAALVNRLSDGRRGARSAVGVAASLDYGYLRFVRVIGFQLYGEYSYELTGLFPGSQYGSAQANLYLRPANRLELKFSAELDSLLVSTEGNTLPSLLVGDRREGTQALAFTSRADFFLSDRRGEYPKYTHSFFMDYGVNLKHVIGTVSDSLGRGSYQQAILGGPAVNMNIPFFGYLLAELDVGVNLDTKKLVWGLYVTAKGD